MKIFVSKEFGLFMFEDYINAYINLWRWASHNNEHVDTLINSVAYEERLF